MDTWNVPKNKKYYNLKNDWRNRARTAKMGLAGPAYIYRGPGHLTRNKGVQGMRLDVSKDKKQNRICWLGGNVKTWKQIKYGIGSRSKARKALIEIFRPRPYVDGENGFLLIRPFTRHAAASCIRHNDVSAAAAARQHALEHDTVIVVIVVVGGS